MKKATPIPFQGEDQALSDPNANQVAGQNSPSNRGRTPAKPFGYSGCEDARGASGDNKIHQGPVAIGELHKVGQGHEI